MWADEEDSGASCGQMRRTQGPGVGSIGHQVSLLCLAERGGRCTSRRGLWEISGSLPLLEPFLRSRSPAREGQRAHGRAGFLALNPPRVATPQALGLWSSGQAAIHTHPAILGSDPQPLPLAGSWVFGPLSSWNAPPCSYCWHGDSARRLRAEKGPVSPYEGVAGPSAPL